MFDSADSLVLFEVTLSRLVWWHSGMNSLDQTSFHQILNDINESISFIKYLEIISNISFYIVFLNPI